MPQRTCVGCRRRADAKGLLRIARSDGALGMDVSGSAPGRGAYVHLDAACVEAALAHGGLARSLRTGLGKDEVGRLKGDIERQMGAS